MGNVMQTLFDGNVVNPMIPVTMEMKNSGINTVTMGEVRVTALYSAVLNEDIEAITTLLKNGADPNMLCEHGRTALHLACEKGNLEIVKLLKTAGADPYLIAFDPETKKKELYGQRYYTNYTPVIIATRKKRTDLLEILLGEIRL